MKEIYLLKIDRMFLTMVVSAFCLAIMPPLYGEVSSFINPSTGILQFRCNGCEDYVAIHSPRPDDFDFAGDKLAFAVSGNLYLINDKFSDRIDLLDRGVTQFKVTMDGVLVYLAGRRLYALFDRQPILISSAATSFMAASSRSIAYFEDSSLFIVSEHDQDDRDAKSLTSCRIDTAIDEVRGSINGRIAFLRRSNLYAVVDKKRCRAAAIDSAVDDFQVGIDGSIVYRRGSELLHAPFGTNRGRSVDTSVESYVLSSDGRIAYQRTGGTLYVHDAEKTPRNKRVGSNTTQYGFSWGGHLFYLSQNLLYTVPNGQIAQEEISNRVQKLIIDESFRVYFLEQNRVFHVSAAQPLSLEIIADRVTDISLRRGRLTFLDFDGLINYNP